MTIRPCTSYRNLPTGEWWIAGEPSAILVTGHVSPRTALAAANHHARTKWGYRSLARQDDERPGYTNAFTEYVYVRPMVCEDNACYCRHFDTGHSSEAYDEPVTGGTPATVVHLMWIGW